MTSESKVLTVIVPSFNMEDYLPKCLSSLLLPDKRLLQRLDVIVVNDGSKDGTSAIAHRFEREHPGVFRVVDKPNGNYGSCINAALPLASGFFVKILDADDSVDTEAFSRLMGVLSEETGRGEDSVDLVTCNHTVVSPGEKTVRLHSLNLEPGVAAPLPETAADRDGQPFFMADIAYRTKLFREFDYTQTEGISYTDIEWSIEPMIRVRRFRHVPVAVNRYLLGRPGQTMSENTYARRYWQIVGIVRGLVRRYPDRMDRCVPEAASYYRGRILKMIEETYGNCLFEYRGKRNRDELRKLDLELETRSELHRASETIRFPSRRMPVRFIHAWRHHPGAGSPAFLSLFLFLALKRRFKRKKTDSRSRDA